MNEINIPTRQAVQRLNETNLIRVLKSGEVPGLVERFVPREQVIEMIRDNVVEVTGPEAIKKSMGMSLKNELGEVYFIETRTE